MNRSQNIRHTVIPGLTLLAACIAIGGWLTWPAGAQDQSGKRPIEHSMRQKLEATSKVLEGLATEDKDLVHEGAGVLTELSKAEVWQVLVDPEYREHTQTFRSAVKRLDEAAQKSEFASAQLEWLDATKRCFDCHNHIRAARAAK
ncbi:MAG: cytochrome c [Planctomycetaceae bacterium]|nr:cytochrome c [Planctomycetaceae bacterium]